MIVSINLPSRPFDTCPRKYPNFPFNVTREMIYNWWLDLLSLSCHCDLGNKQLYILYVVTHRCSWSSKDYTVLFKYFEFILSFVYLSMLSPYYFNGLSDFETLHPECVCFTIICWGHVLSTCHICSEFISCATYLPLSLPYKHTHTHVTSTPILKVSNLS